MNNTEFWQKRGISRTLGSIIEAVILGVFLTTAFMVAQVTLTGTPVNWLEAGAVATSFACTWLCTRQVRANYIFGVVSTSLLCIVFFQANLLGSMALNLYLIPTVIIGWFMWGKDTRTRPVQHVKPIRLLIYAAVTAATWLGAYLTIRHLGGSLGALDGWLLVGSILAQFLLDRKKIETWIVWAAVNIVSIYVYFDSGLYLLAGQFFLFLVNAVYAWFAWHKTLEKEVTNEAGIDFDDSAIAYNGAR